MRLFFAGAENSEWRKFLVEEGITDVSMSYVKLTSRVKFARPWTIAGHFPDQNVLLDAGGYSFNKAGAEVTEEDAMDMANRYMAFVSQNIDAVELVTEFDANILGRDWIQAMREDFYDDLGDRFVPVWRAEDGTAALDSLAARYAHVGVLSAGLDHTAAPTLNSIASRFGVRLHGLGMADWELIRAVKFDSVSSGSWIKPSQYGETIIWTGHELKRYPKDYKDQCRKRHRSYLERLGLFDVGKIIADDRKEVLRLSVWSWQQFIASLEHRRVLDPFRQVTDPGGAEDGENAERAGGVLDNPPSPAGNEHLLPSVPVRRALRPVPGVEVVMGTPGEDDPESASEPLMAASDESLLQCSTCEIRDMCPEARPGHSCAFSFPAYVTTKNQMRSLQDWLIKLQTQRVQRMSMIEQVKGGYTDQNLSAEEDRLQRMINAKREADKAGFTFELKASGDGSTGAISRLFGRDVGDAATALPAPVRAEQVMDDSGIVEAEIVGEGE